MTYFRIVVGSPPSLVIPKTIIKMVQTASFDSAARLSKTEIKGWVVYCSVYGNMNLDQL